MPWTAISGSGSKWRCLILIPSLRTLNPELQVFPEAPQESKFSYEELQGCRMDFNCYHLLRGEPNLHIGVASKLGNLNVYLHPY